jgi:hypothetical protein
MKSLILDAVPESEQAIVLGMFRGARAHDFEWLLRLYYERGGQAMPPTIMPEFVRVNTWTTDLRYFPGTIKEKDAIAFIESATKVIAWADGRL